MQEILNMFKKNTNDKKFDHIKISLASPDLMRSWSYGEVKKPETINYRTFKPERVAYFVQRYLDQLKITNACVENTNASSTEEWYVRNAELRLLYPKLEEREWVISN